MFNTVLIANRGEIAVRAIRTLKRLGVKSVAVYSDADRNAQHVRDADVAIALGGDKPADSYLRIDRILAAAQETGAQAIYPGYGFLSESAEFADACEAAGIAFVGPTGEQIREFGLKHRARELAGEAQVPMAPGTGLLQSLEEALAAAEGIGYPVMLKTTAGGGGIGLTRCADAEALASAYDSVKRMGEQFFSDAGVFLERFVDQARHVEVQIFGDGQGRVAALGERDCSLQRRNQKVVEETPAPNLPQATRERLHAAAVQLGESVSYRSAGTVEFIYDAARDDFYFLEVNTRLQVEHPVTEMVTGLDLIECMLRVAAGDALDWAALDRAPQGAAIEVRIYAEDPLKNFQPSPGVLTEVHFPEGVRVDGWVATGSEVSAFYDPMIAKLIVHGQSRDEAIAKLRAALGETRLHGIASNLDYLRQVVADPRFARGEVWTRLLDTFAFKASVIEVLEPGTYSSVQDYPGRLGYWDIGVPPSGPMDDFAFRLANRIVGNHADAAGLEFTLQGPTLRFHCDALIALLKEFHARHPHLRLILEPGSAFTWRTGYLVSTVEDIVVNGDVRTAMLDVSFACHMPDCLEMPYKPAIVGAHDPVGDEPRWRMGGTSCLAGDYYGDWAFDHELKVGERIVFEDMIHYTMVKTTMFNGVQHPSIVIVRRDGRVDVIRRFGYEDFKNRMS